MESDPNDHSSGDGTRKQPTPALTLERVIGQTCLYNSALAVNPVTGDVAYPAGCMVVIYQPRHNRQSRFFHSTKTVSCLAFSADGTYLAVGERGHQPSIVVWSLGSGLTIAEFKNGHRFGVSCLTFSPAGNLLVSAGYKYDRQIRVWDVESAMVASVTTSCTNTGKMSSKSIDSSSDEVIRPTFLLASSKVSQKVRSVVFSHGGSFFVTCGDRHVKFWAIERGGFGEHCEETKDGQPTTNGKDISVTNLTGHPASTLEGLSDSIFMDVACYQREDGIETVYAVTSSAVLCVFLAAQRVMERWINLEADNAYGLSVCDQLLCIGCSNGILRLFNAGSLQFISTLPKPPPLGMANVSSTRELKTLIGSSASTQIAIEQNTILQQHIDLSYASVLGVRLSPSRTKVVAVYADRTFVMWDITETRNIGKYRSFLSHSGCIWDIQCIPSRSGGSRSCDDRRDMSTAQLSIPDGTIVTCSADNTIRVWNINALDGSSVTRDGLVGEDPSSTVSKMWVNLYSQHLLRILYVNSLDGGVSESPHNSLSSDECNRGRYDDETPKRKTRFSSQCSGIPDVESLPTSNSSMSPRSLAVHPDGLQLACGDKQGKISVYNLTGMELVHSQMAHDGEVLCMDYSPTMELNNRSHAAGGGVDEVAGIHSSESWRAIRPNHPLIINPRGDANDECLKRTQQQLVLLATASRDRLVHIFDASDRSKVSNDKAGNGVLDNSYPLLETTTDHCSSVTAVKFSKDGRRIATAGGDRTLILNNVHGKCIRKLRTISVPQGTIYGLGVDPTSKYLVSTGQDKVNIWSMATGSLARSYSPGDGVSGDWGETYKVDLDPTGSYAATCSFDKYIRIFDFYSGRCLCKVSGHCELVTGVRFSLDGRRLISIGGDGCIFIWRLSTVLQQAMHDRLCELYPGCIVSTNSRGEVGVGNGLGGSASPVARDTGVAATLNRARAKEDAKARLKLHKSQLPAAWAAAQMVTQNLQNDEVENTSSCGAAMNKDKLSSHHQQVWRQGESGSYGAVRGGSSVCSPEPCKQTVPTTAGVPKTVKPQQEGDSDVTAGLIGNSFSHQTVDAVDIGGDVTVPNHFEDKLDLNNSSDDFGGDLDEKKTCVEEGVNDDQQEEIHNGNGTMVKTTLDEVTRGLNEVNGVQGGGNSVTTTSTTTTAAALAPDVINDVIITNKHEDEIISLSTHDNLVPPEILHTPPRRSIEGDGNERIDSSTTKRISSIEESKSSPQEYDSLSSFKGHISDDDASFIKYPNSSSNRALVAPDKGETIVESGAKTIDNHEIITNVRVVENETEREETAEPSPTQESYCFSNSNDMKREAAIETEKAKNEDAAICELQKFDSNSCSSPSPTRYINTNGGDGGNSILPYHNREGYCDEGMLPSSTIVENCDGENGNGNSGLLHLNPPPLSSSKIQSRGNDMSDLKQSCDDADESISKRVITTAAGGLRGNSDAIVQIHADSFAIELPHPPSPHGISSPRDKDIVQEEQRDKGDVTKMYAKRKETENAVDRMRSSLAAMGFLGDSPESPSPRAIRISPRRFPPPPPVASSSSSPKVIKEPQSKTSSSKAPALNVETTAPLPLLQSSSPALEKNSTSHHYSPQLGLVEAINVSSRNGRRRRTLPSHSGVESPTPTTRCNHPVISSSISPVKPTSSSSSEMFSSPISAMGHKEDVTDMTNASMAGLLLPRQQAEYVDALQDLKRSAARAKQLYRELSVVCQNIEMERQMIVGGATEKKLATMKASAEGLLATYSESFMAISDFLGGCHSYKNERQMISKVDGTTTRAPKAGQERLESPPPIPSWNCDTASSTNSNQNYNPELIEPTVPLDVSHALERYPNIMVDMVRDKLSKRGL